MFKLYLLVKWFCKFHFGKKQNKLTAEFLFNFHSDDKDKRELEVGKALLLAENQEYQEKLVKKLLKYYVNPLNWFNGSWEEREPALSEEEPKGTE